MWWLAETVSNCLSTPVCQSCPSLIPPPTSSSSLVLLLQLLIIFSLNCRGQTTFSDGVVTLLLLLGKIFYLGKNTQPADMCSCFLAGKEMREAHLFFLLFFDTFTDSRLWAFLVITHWSRSEPERGIMKILTKSTLKEWTRVHTLSCIYLKWKLLTGTVKQTLIKAWSWSFLEFSSSAWKLFKDI